MHAYRFRELERGSTVSSPLSYLMAVLHDTLNLPFLKSYNATLSNSLQLHHLHAAT